jgi:hypothetical protein
MIVGEDDDKIDTYMYTVYLPLLLFIICQDTIPLIIAFHGLHITVKTTTTKDIGLLLIN